MPSSRRRENRPEPLPIRGLLWDAAGTLFEPACPVAETYANTTARRGLHVPAREIEAVFAEVFGNAPPMCFPDAGVDEIPELERSWWRQLVEEVLLRASRDGLPRDFDACFAELFEHFSRASSWRLLPGAAEVLAHFHAGDVRQGIASNFDLRLHEILVGLDIAKYFHAVVLPAETRTCKPDPRFFYQALAKLDAEAPEVVFLGDDPERDIAGARAVGMHGVYAPGLATLLDLPDLISNLEEFDPQRSTR